MKKIIFIAIFLLAAGCQPTYSRTPIKPVQPAPQPEPVACTQEAQLCPDGSYVSRTGPNCEFTACPSATSTPISQDTGIAGKIVLGPTCPVERIPPDPACAPRPYQATIVIKSSDGKTEIKRFTSKADGTFIVSLVEGTYLLVPISANIYPRGSEQTVMVEKNKFTEVTINFDSGIR